MSSCPAAHRSISVPSSRGFLKPISSPAYGYVSWPELGIAVILHCVSQTHFNQPRTGSDVRSPGYYECFIDPVFIILTSSVTKVNKGVFTLYHVGLVWLFLGSFHTKRRKCITSYWLDVSPHEQKIQEVEGTSAVATVAVTKGRMILPRRLMNELSSCWWFTTQKACRCGSSLRRYTDRLSFSFVCLVLLLPCPIMLPPSFPAVRGSEPHLQPFTPALCQVLFGCGTLFGIHTHFKGTRQGQFLSAWGWGEFSLLWEGLEWEFGLATARSQTEHLANHRS